MFRKLVVVVLAFACTVVAAPAADARQDPMTGAWSGTDVDGSTLHVTIGGGEHRLVFQDDGATVCLTAFGEFTKASGSAFGQISGNRLEATMDLYCHLSSGKTLWMSHLQVEYEYDPASDTMIDQTGQCFHRPSSASDCP
ncbi:MAG: hypothetical protein GY720_10565 [bacterium]|nr:hypothetical protein [bacterium]MCP5030650.1 hypothetical protein [Actinomycetes bacterium]